MPSPSERTSSAQASFCKADGNLARGSAATGSLPPSQPDGFPLLTAAQLRRALQGQIWLFLTMLCPGSFHLGSAVEQDGDVLPRAELAPCTGTTATTCFPQGRNHFEVISPLPWKKVGHVTNISRLLIFFFSFCSGSEKQNHLFLLLLEH